MKSSPTVHVYGMPIFIQCWCKCHAYIGMSYMGGKLLIQPFHWRYFIQHANYFKLLIRYIFQLYRHSKSKHRVSRMSFSPDTAFMCTAQSSASVGMQAKYRWDLLKQSCKIFYILSAFLRILTFLFLSPPVLMHGGLLYVAFCLSVRLSVTIPKVTRYM